MKKYFWILFVIVCCQNQLTAQFNDFTGYKQIAVSAGLNQFLGDLGGSDQLGQAHSLRDLDFRSTTFNLKAGYLIELNRWFCSSSFLTYGIFKGNDEFTQEPSRQNRNLHFRSNYVSLESRMNISLFQPKHKSYKQFSSKKFLSSVYVFSGLGVTFFNPKAKVDDKWVALQPIGTEGQGRIPGKTKYRRNTLIIPFGVGAKYNVNKYWQIGVEATYFKTYSDYIDDVGGTYCSPNLFQNSNEAYLANPALNETIDYTGETRGKDGKDSYYNFNVLVYRKLSSNHPIIKYKF